MAKTAAAGFELVQKTGFASGNRIFDAPRSDMFRAFPGEVGSMMAWTWPFFHTGGQIYEQGLI